MTKIDRRLFLGLLPALAASLSGLAGTRLQKGGKIVMTVRGPVSPGSLGQTLIHEHILVDFIGARLTTPERWNRDEVEEIVLPYLDEAKAAGCNTLIDCTPNYLGRDVLLLKSLSAAAGLHIVTNTGYYGGSDHKFLPDHAFTESTGQLAARWTNEWKLGIEKSGVKPGFIKISVNAGSLSEVSQKLIRAAALTHLKTGLTIASHTGPATPAFEQIGILKQDKIDASAFIWVHAQNEPDKKNYVRAVREGAWVSLDGLNDQNVDEYVEQLLELKKENCLHRVLVSHDAGWYEPGQPGGGKFRGYTTLFKKLIPKLERAKFEQQEVRQLIMENPQNAFAVSIRRPGKK